MMRNQLQIEGLRTYIFTYKSVYSKLSIAKLSTIFALPEEKITEIVTKMGELVENGYINFSTAANRSKLQELAILMNEKYSCLQTRMKRHLPVVMVRNNSLNKPLNNLNKLNQRKTGSELLTLISTTMSFK